MIWWKIRTHSPQKIGCLFERVEALERAVFGKDAEHVKEMDRQLRKSEGEWTIASLLQQIKILKGEEDIMPAKGQRDLKTDRQLRDSGYQFVSYRRCTYAPCEEQIELWRTPKGRIMPFHRVEAEGAFDTPDEGKKINTLEPHFALCKGIAGRNQARAEGRPQEPESEQPQEAGSEQ